MNLDKSILYVVATPIGNMSDITDRAIQTLKDVDIIYAEDTRQTYKLLSYFNIKNTVYQLHKHNESKEKESILQHLNEGKNIAIVSDAGTPLVCDPGYIVTQYLRENSANIQVIPGCCSVIAALSISGLPADQFSFAGFIPSKQGQRKTFLTQYQYSQQSTIFFETPHRIIDSLSDFKTVFGGDRKIFIARELTKKFEDTALLSIDEVQNWITDNENRIRGEFVLILEKTNLEQQTDWEGLAKIMIANNVSTKTTSKIISEQTGLSKKEIYNYILENFK